MLVLLDSVRANGDCPYLPGRPWASHTLWVEAISRDEYRELLERGYRRSGRILYQTRCQGCRECRPTRVDLAAFSPSRSQRRCLAANRDLDLEIGRPRFSPDRHELHERYCAARHSRPDGEAMSAEEFAFFMVDSPVATRELSFRYADGGLAGVALVDDVGEVWSSVFTYFDPDASHRGLGTWAILQTIEQAQRRGARWLHLGFHVAGSRAMRYKLRFQPAEILGAEHGWQRALPTIGGGEVSAEPPQAPLLDPHAADRSLVGEAPRVVEADDQRPGDPEPPGQVPPTPSSDQN